MSGKSYLLAVDQGTTGTTALLVELSGTEVQAHVVSKATVEFPQHYPKPGWVEHRLDEIWRSVESAISSAMDQAKRDVKGFDPRSIAAVGITNQRETLCLFDREGDAAAAPAIVWQCRRSTEICERLKHDGVEEEIRKKTGLVLDPYFSGSKLCWVIENNDRVANDLKSGKVLVGTIDTWLLYRMTGGATFATEPSNASRTMLLDIVKGTWDPDLLRMFKVPGTHVLPEVRGSAGLFGKTKGMSALPDGLPICGILGDQQAAMAGQACYSVGEAKCTYGTGAFLLMNTGTSPIVSDSGMLTTIAWSLGGKLTYALEGASFIAGAAVQFLRDQMGFITAAREIESLASPNPAAPHVYFVPSLTGLGAPHWDPRSRGAFLGMTRGTSRADLARATLEGIAFQVRDLAEAMAKDLRKPLKVLRVDGGASANDLLMQIQSDYLQVDVDRPRNLETTAFGACMFAGLGASVFGGLNELTKVRSSERIFSPRDDENTKKELRDQIAGWRRAVAAVRHFALSEN